MFYVHDESNLYDGNEGGARCRLHPSVVISSPCGQFDAPCLKCEDAEPPESPRSGVLTIHVYGTRRCHAHPHVVLSSPCGQFDALCGECEDAAYRAEQEEQEAAAPSPSPVVLDAKSDDFPF